MENFSRVMKKKINTNDIASRFLPPSIAARRCMRQPEQSTSVVELAAGADPIDAPQEREAAPPSSGAFDRL